MLHTMLYPSFTTFHNQEVSENLLYMKSIVQWRRGSDVEAPSRTLSNPGRAAPVVQLEPTNILW